MIESLTYTVPQGAEILGKGLDSIVYRAQGDSVLKVYPGMPSWQIDFYRDITNQATERLAKQPFCGEIPIAGEAVPFMYTVNPISDTGLTEQRFPVAESPYVAGPRLVDFIRYDRFTIPVEMQLQTIDDQDERRKIKEFADKVIFFHLNDSLNRCSEINSFSQTFNKELSVRGIVIAPVNVKVRYNQEGILFVVTDLCNSVRALMPIKGYANES